MNQSWRCHMPRSSVSNRRPNVVPRSPVGEPALCLRNISRALPAAKLGLHECSLKYEWKRWPRSVTRLITPLSDGPVFFPVHSFIRPTATLYILMSMLTYIEAKMSRLYVQIFVGSPWTLSVFSFVLSRWRQLILQDLYQVNHISEPTSLLNGFWF